MPETIKVADRAPVASGSNWSSIVQLLCAASVLPQVVAVGGACRKSEGFAPVKEMLKFVAEL